MPKLKTKKTLAKRIKVSASGKLIRDKIATSHKKQKLGSSKKHRKNRDGQVSSGFEKSLKGMLH